ncbi:hypothetical protein [Streptomyces sp. SPB4]|uniref:hypothetical protein n=1 Tax=Streptomyces sp. SPB4 TaxID=2940553 RepID=UPI002475E300|nr:hypothetical protein [Streptomyces sp. SPB4]MDH6545201.1 hypothetical protein [Streptomyces sp. SPB4]
MRLVGYLSDEPQSWVIAELVTPCEARQSSAMSSFPGTRPGCGRRGIEGTHGRAFLACGLAWGTPTGEGARFGFADGVLFRSIRARV